jgi:hypothetical protein
VPEVSWVPWAGEQGGGSRWLIAVPAACTETLTDGQGRAITMNYASNAGGTWTDTIVWPGPKPNVILTTNVNWNTGTPYALPYYCQTAPTGITNTGFTCTLQQTASLVSSVQQPPASTGGNSVNFLFNYSPWTITCTVGESFT